MADGENIEWQQSLSEKLSEESWPIEFQEIVEKLSKSEFTIHLVFNYENQQKSHF